MSLLKRSNSCLLTKYPLFLCKLTFVDMDKEFFPFEDQLNLTHLQQACLGLLHARPISPNSQICQQGTVLKQNSNARAQGLQNVATNLSHLGLRQLQSCSSASNS